MGRLVARLFVLLVLFTLSMALVATGIFAATWWLWVIGLGVLVVFVALGGLLVPSAQRQMPHDRIKSAAALLQAFGSVCAAELLGMGLVTWCYGNRSLSGNDAYQALGLIIFLGLLGVGVQGTIATIARFTYVYNHPADPSIGGRR